MRDAGALLYEVLCRLREAVQPGMSTAALDVYAEQLIRKNHAIPSFLHYEGYPASICASIDDAVVHGIPSEKQILREGQILSIDCGLVLDGWQADSAFTMGIGEISPEAQRLIDVTEQCFFAGARQAIAGKRLGDVGHAVQQVAESKGRTQLMAERIPAAAGRRLSDERHRLEMLSQNVRALDPQLILDRGYSITLLNGKAVRNSSELAPGDELHTRFAEGEVKSVVE